MYLLKIVRIFSLINSTAGRNEIWFKLRNFLWPILYKMAFWYRKYFIKKVKIIVIVGSLGKTTTSAVIKNFLGYHVQDKFESNALGAVASQILDINAQEKYKIIEIGIGRKGDMIKYAKMILPNYVVITSIASDHSNIIGSTEEIWKEKAKILRGPIIPEVVFLNGDDPNVLKIGDTINTKKITFGIGSKNIFQCVESRLNWPYGNSIKVKINQDVESFDFSLYGEKMVYCFLAGIAVAFECKIPLEKIKKRALKIQPVYGRMQVKKLQSGAYLICDEFKSSLESLNSAFHFLEQIPSKRRIVILGTVSHITSKSRHKYKQLGLKIGAIADMLIVVSSKDYEQALSSSAKKAGISVKDTIKTKGDWSIIPGIISKKLEEGDVILIKASRNQKLERLSLILQGKDVRCFRKNCELKYIYCKDCSKLN